VFALSFAMRDELIYIAGITLLRSVIWCGSFVTNRGT
jgi:uncharacterized MAPEG superfamily protein